MQPRPFRAARPARGVPAAHGLLFPLASRPCLPGPRGTLTGAQAVEPGHRCALLGVRFTVAGRPFADCPTLFVANHVSYIDVLVLGAGSTALHRQGRDRALAAVRPLARMTRTFFVRRHWRQALIQRNALAARMRAGESFILFAEGTSTDGLAVRRFKTTLLSVAEPWVLDCPVAVQAVTLSYVRLADGTPIGRANCDLYAWHGDAALPAASLAACCSRTGSRSRSSCTNRCCPGRCRAASCSAASCTRRSRAAGARRCRAAKPAPSGLPTARHGPLTRRRQEKGGLRLLFRSDLRVWACASL